MQKIQLLKEPGYIYDLNFIFCLKFNTDLYISKLPNDDRKDEHVKFFKDISARFGDIPNELYVFFHAIDTERAFLPAYYFYPYQDRFSTEYHFKFMQKELFDQDRLVRNLIKFYLYELDDEAVERCANSFQTVFYYIKDSHYSDEEKNRLYEFFINPTPYIRTLQYELMAKEVMLAEYYKDNYQKIIDVYNQTTAETLCEQLKNFRNLDINDNNDTLYISCCLLNKFCIYLCFINDSFLPLLGIEYVSILNSIKDIEPNPNLQSLGTALCEESRVKILQVLLEREKVTCKDLEKIFSFSGSTAYHHLAIMNRAGLIKTQNEGKTVLYSLNRRYFDAVIGVLSKYTSKRKGH